MTITEKSVSKSQQRLMGMVHAYKQGKLKLSDIKSKILQNKIRDMANNLTDIDAKKFAKTKHSGLPNKVSESALKKLIFEVVTEIITEIGTVVYNDAAMQKLIQLDKFLKFNYSITPKKIKDRKILFNTYVIDDVGLFAKYKKLVKSILRDENN